MRLAIGIRSQLYRIAIATMHFCFGFHFYDVDPDCVTKILVNISWDRISGAIVHGVMGLHIMSLLEVQKPILGMHRP